MNHTQSSFRLSTEPAAEPLGPPRNTTPPPGGDAAVSPAQWLRLHAPSSDRGTESRPVSPEAADRAAEEIVDGVLKAAHRLRGLLSGHFSEFDLTDVRYSVLRFLRDAEPHGCTQSEIAEHLDQSESSISTLVKRMRKSELLYRLRSGIDKRKWVLKLTNRGSSLLDTARRCHAERMDQFLRAFDSDERLNLTGMLSKLVTELTPQEIPPASVVETPGDGPTATVAADSGPAEHDATAVAGDIPNTTAGEAPAA